MHPGQALFCLSMKPEVPFLGTLQIPLWPPSSVPVATLVRLALEAYSTMMMMRNSQNPCPNQETPSGNREGKANLGLQHPVGLWFEGLDFVMSLHAEPQGRGLTWPKGDEGAV